jgi:hypothetical protein
MAPESRCAKCAGWSWWRSAAGPWCCWCCTPGPHDWQHDPAIEDVAEPNFHSIRDSTQAIALGSQDDIEPAR